MASKTHTPLSDTILLPFSLKFESLIYAIHISKDMKRSVSIYELKMNALERMLGKNLDSEELHWLALRNMISSQVSSLLNV